MLAGGEGAWSSQERRIAFGSERGRDGRRHGGRPASPPIRRADPASPVAGDAPLPFDRLNNWSSPNGGPRTVTTPSRRVWFESSGLSCPYPSCGATNRMRERSLAAERRCPRKAGRGASRSGGRICLHQGAPPAGWRNRGRGGSGSQCREVTDLVTEVANPRKAKCPGRGREDWRRNDWPSAAGFGVVETIRGGRKCLIRLQDDGVRPLFLKKVTRPARSGFRVVAPSRTPDDPDIESLLRGARHDLRLTVVEVSGCEPRLRRPPRRGPSRHRQSLGRDLTAQRRPLFKAAREGGFGGSRA